VGEKGEKKGEKFHGEKKNRASAALNYNSFEEGKRRNKMFATLMRKREKKRKKVGPFLGGGEKKASIIVKYPLKICWRGKRRGFKS